MVRADRAVGRATGAPSRVSAWHYAGFGQVQPAETVASAADLLVRLAAADTTLDTGALLQEEMVSWLN